MRGRFEVSNPGVAGSVRSSAQASSRRSLLLARNSKIVKDLAVLCLANGRMDASKPAQISHPGRSPSVPLSYSGGMYSGGLALTAIVTIVPEDRLRRGRPGSAALRGDRPSVGRLLQRNIKFAGGFLHSST
jgi:hypothetical protein